MNKNFHKAIWQMVITDTVDHGANPDELAVSEFRTEACGCDFSELVTHLHEELPPEYWHLIRGIYGFVEIFCPFIDDVLNDEAAYMIVFAKDWQILLKLNWDYEPYVSLMGMVINPAEALIKQDQTDTSWRWQRHIPGCILYCSKAPSTAHLRNKEY